SLLLDIIRPTPRSTLFPYTTLFRSKHIFCEKPVAIDPPGIRRVLEAVRKSKAKNLALMSGFCFRYANPNRSVFARVREGAIGDRSEEHTSELQSRENLVCRLLLEKK